MKRLADYGMHISSTHNLQLFHWCINQGSREARRGEYELTATVPWNLSASIMLLNIIFPREEKETTTPRCSRAFV